MLITQQKNTFLADLGAIFKGWFGEAAGLLKADLMVEGKTPQTPRRQFEQQKVHL